MRLALEILKNHPDSTMIERLEYDIEQMNQLIGNVLDLARGLAHEKPVLIDLPDYLAQLARDHATSTNPVSVNCPPCQVAAPRVALQRAIGNLLQNANRYAPGGVDLVVEMTAQQCHIGVLDRGPGIAADQLEAVFEPFFRLDASRSPVTGGSGLGLAIVRELARVNGWQVKLLARGGGGLQAWIELTLPGA
jgi:two-component system osmolarity sensor histidine kinase EnvZ